ncbi:hypothetical protein [Natronolimnohabitans innermongolicus]|uniref:Uncharacterized protein n=1 Tax=Natronolimnohabitans innermongolicus JCM 12255 TaxID=1227499 RepID=L9XF05_9EURY|nr:hypothetical protein [Natronolimnohabitans innermongolicus]ELY59976.1 hypothetical protein C493_04568 [Natronolimnohabitans innermongolicus JCM 12255]
MSDEVPVESTDLLVLIAVSLGGGTLIASLLVTPAVSPQFINAIFVSAMFLAFFLFIPIMGARLFIDDDGEESDPEAETDVEH